MSPFKQVRFGCRHPRHYAITADLPSLHQNPIKEAVSAAKKMVEFDILSHTRNRTKYWCGFACSAWIFREEKPRDYLLVGAEEVVVGGVRYERLLTDVGECGASGSRSGSSPRI